MIWLIPFLLFAAEESKPPAPTVEQLQARVAQLEQQLEQVQKSYQFEMAICSGALNAARQVALTPAQKPQPQSTRPKPEAKKEEKK